MPLLAELENLELAMVSWRIDELLAVVGFAILYYENGWRDCTSHIVDDGRPYYKIRSNWLE